MRTIGVPVLTPYTATLRLRNAIGTKGIEMGGATRSLRSSGPADSAGSPTWW
jgi:hypothetical protein